MKETILKSIADALENGIANSHTYLEYRELVSGLVSEGKSTGVEQSESLTNYSMLNDRRMRRWDKTLKIALTPLEKVSNTKLDVTWLVLTEGWCGDAAHILPVLNKIAMLNDGIDLKIVLRDEHKDLMDAFLTNGNKAIPKLIMLDNATRQVLHTWGPRPTIATKMVNDYKTKHGGLDANFKEELQGWYNKDKGENIVSDITALL